MVSRYTSALGYAVSGGSAAEMYERLQAAGYLLATADRESVTSLIERTLDEYLPDECGLPYGEIAFALKKSPFLSDRGREAADHTVTWDGKEIEARPPPEVFLGEAPPMHTRIVVTRYGGPEVLRTIEEGRPVPRAGEVRVRMLAAGVSLPDVVAREGIHPETPKVPFTLVWDLVGVVDRLGKGVTAFEPGQTVAAMPIHGAYAEFVCLPERALVPVPAGLDPAEAVSVILNYVTAYQMLHRSVKVGPGRRALVHGASGGVGSALLQLGRLLGLDEYGTCSARGAAAVAALGAVPIDYEKEDFVDAIRRRTGDGVDVVFDGIGGAHIWRSRKALRRGGRVVAYGLTGSLRKGRLASGRTSGRHRFREIAVFGVSIARSWLLPGDRRVVPYSIQTLMRLKPAWFRQDLIALFELLRRREIEPLVAERLPLTEARRAHEQLGRGGVIGKIVLLGSLVSAVGSSDAEAARGPALSD
jgi:NADPH2:quinone reductase